MTTTQLPEIDVKSREWVDQMIVNATNDNKSFSHLGFADLRLALEVVDLEETYSFGIVLDGYDFDCSGEIDDFDDFQPEVTLSGTVAIWEEMLLNIKTHGVADTAHTLNTLTIAEFPMQAKSPDPIGRDKFFRYAATLQELFDHAFSHQKSSDK
ncbi:MAG: hypothetical protein HKL80_08460 [Acidimicrobiales bacterium]|nr:hypothetical protein [Acidimicrobiales bacterium]